MEWCLPTTLRRGGGRSEAPPLVFLSVQEGWSTLPLLLYADVRVTHNDDIPKRYRLYADVRTFRRLIMMTFPKGIAPRKINTNTTVVSVGSVDDVTYTLAGAPPSWFSSAKTGEIFGIFQTPGQYTFSLYVIDAGLQSQLMEASATTLSPLLPLSPSPPLLSSTLVWGQLKRTLMMGGGAPALPRIL